MRPKQTDKVLAAFGQAVKAYRVACGLTQEQLADAADLHPGYLGAVERGEKNIGLQNIIALARALAVPPSGLMAVLDVAIAPPVVPRMQQIARVTKRGN
ncbi:MAG: helix-turn-helix transcriptional regulator [Burkholderiaceae bacterium]|jgi:transcriptional regulator with XRE-family HTH domain|nr:helix-turn-helix transcriptional regulator [Burkholderiaceae bacterium]